jgi:uncharacterized protein (TIGR00251 family)
VPILRRSQAGVAVRVRVQPGARRNAVSGVGETAEGPALRVSVTAAPEGGKANAAVCALLAKAWGVAKSDVAVTRGQTARLKTVHVTGDPETLEARLGAWFNEAR